MSTIINPKEILMPEAIKSASVLAFERKLDTSDAVLSYGIWENRDQEKEWCPVIVREKSVRGTISNRLSAKDQDPLKLDASIEKPNLQTIDVATIPDGSDTLRVRFTLRVLPGVGVPSACNSPEFKQRLSDITKSYMDTHGLTELSHRYAFNLANGRFLWRNRLGAEKVEVRVRKISGGKIENSWIFNGMDFSLRHFDAPSHSQDSLDNLASTLQEGLAGTRYVLLDVEAFVRMGPGEVFPSQELILDRGQGKKSKTLYQIEGSAGIHSQKISNAIRTIDTWYPDGSYPIAVEPYGSVTSEGRAYRQPRVKSDFYSLFDNWIKDKPPTIENQHFVMAILIRGGVFGEKSE